MREKILIIVLLFIFWLALSGHFEYLIVLLGAISAVIVTYLSARMRLGGIGEHRLLFYLKLTIYIIWLTWKIILANVQVAYRILHPRLPVEPQYLQIKLAGDTPLFHLIHANSITLTPGTISVDIKDGIIHVHALSNANIGDLLKGEIADKILWLQGKRNG